MRSVAAGIVVALLLTACGGAQRDEVVVSAAASLTDAFTALEDEFEATHPCVDIVLNLGGSSTLREQILSGAPVDVFAPASTAVMDDVVVAGLVDGHAVVFATNHMVLAVPAGNPAGVTRLADLEDPGLLVGLCAPEVPCGALAAEVLAAAGVDAAPDTLEPDVRALRTKLELGELDAGLLYASDVAGQAGFDSIAIGADDLVTRYSIAVLAASGDTANARRFVGFVTSATGSAALRLAGFGSP